MAKKVLTKNDLLSMVNRRNKAQLVWGIIATALGGVFTTIALIGLFYTGLTGLVLLPSAAAPLVAGILLLCKRKTKRASIVENNAFSILAMPVVGKDTSETDEGTIYCLHFPNNFDKNVSPRDYNNAPIGAIYYFVSFGENDLLGKCYTAAEYQLSEELLPLVKLVQ